jgi:hypothetical protein
MPEGVAKVVEVFFESLENPSRATGHLQYGFINRAKRVEPLEINNNAPKERCCPSTDSAARTEGKRPNFRAS